MPESPPLRPRVGVGVILRRPDGAFLIGERKGSHGAGQLALPGGALELYETVRQCATRETLEEVGVRVPEDAWRAPFTVAEAVIDANNHWITIFALAHVDADVNFGNMEPHKCAGWSFKRARDVRDVPDEGVFLPLRLLMRDENANVDEACVPEGFVVNGDGVYEPA